MKLIVTDLDGTLMNCKNEIMPMTKETLIKLQAKGFSVVLASGRDINSTIEIGKNINISEYPQSGYICLNGLEGYNHKGELLFEEKKLTFEDSLYLEEISKKYKLDMILFFKDYFVAIKNSDYEIKNIPLNADLIVDSVNQIENYYFNELRKIVFFESSDKINAQFKNLVSDTMNYDLCRVEESWIEINPYGINKGNALLKMCKIKGISIEDSIAFGNGENDISMIKTAGIGIAMGNAMNTVKEIADIVIYTNNEDGIGKYLNENYVSK